MSDTKFLILMGTIYIASASQDNESKKNLGWLLWIMALVSMFLKVQP